MGRYFPYTVQPITVGEIEINNRSLDLTINPPNNIIDTAWENLKNFGGFPEPFLQANTQFFNQWQNMRFQQLFKEDILNMSQVVDIAQLEVLAQILKSQSGDLLNYTSLAKHVRVSDQTIRRWLDLLDSVYYSFRIKPWSTNVVRSLKKEPKVYLWDWSLVEDTGSKSENFIASHLQKTVQFWTQIGLGKFELFFIRDKEKQEVDFLVVKNQKPWFLVDVKHSDNNSISENLYKFQSQLNAPHAF